MHATVRDCIKSALMSSLMKTKMTNGTTYCPVDSTDVCKQRPWDCKSTFSAAFRTGPVALSILLWVLEQRDVNLF